MEPMLAARTKDVFPGLDMDQIRDAMLADPGWALDIKCDGDRALVVQGEGLTRSGKRRVYGRDGQQASRALPAAVTDVLDEMFPDPTTRFALDGELVDGVLWLFDAPVAPVVGTEVGPGHLWLVRRTALDLLCVDLDPAGPVRQVASATGDDRLTLWEAGVGGNVEGFVLKRVDSPYLAGARSRNWVKAKRRPSVDCVVVALRPDGKENATVGLYQPDGTLTPVGTVALHEGDGPRMQPGDVVEITIRKATTNNRLVEAKKPILRTDKRPDECTIDQLDDCRRARTLEFT